MRIAWGKFSQMSLNFDDCKWNKLVWHDVYVSAFALKELNFVQ